MKEVKIIVEGNEYQVGKEYEFFDCLQREKGFTVQYHRGNLEGYKHVNGSANCWHPHNTNQVFIYIREIHPMNGVLDFIDSLMADKYFNSLEVKNDLKEIGQMILEPRDV